MSTPSLPEARVNALFEIRTELDAQVLLRILGLFAKSDLIPDAIAARRIGAELVISIEQPGFPAHTAEIVSAKIESMVAVSQVRLTLAPDACTSVA